MTQALLTPRVTTAQTGAGTRLFWKQLLPLGQINYQGRTLSFDRGYLTDLATAFADRAYDMTPIQLADAENRHNMSPELMRGEVRQVEVRDDGLYGLVDLSADAAQLVAERPQLGVSVRIVEDLQRADGKRWPRALQHVLLTADPRLTGMAPWAAVDLAGDLTPVLDLSAETYTRGALVATLTDQEQRVLDSLLAKRGPEPAPAPAVTETAPVVPTLSENPDEWTEAQVDAFLESALAEPTPVPAVLEPVTQPVVEPVTEPTPVLVGAALSNPAPGEAARIAALELSVATSSWREERQNWVSAGVPPVLLDRAAPLLSQPARGQVDLSNGTTLDPFAVVRSVLDAAKGTVDLSSAAGSAVAPDPADPQSVEAVRQSPVYQNWSF